MTVERILRAAAGIVVLVSLLLSLASPWWLLLTAFAGINLLQSAFTNWCPLMAVLKKLGFRSCD